jgi:hypothetical protein
MRIQEMINEIIDKKELKRRVAIMFGMWVFSACLIMVLAGIGVHVDVATTFDENIATLFMFLIVVAMCLHLMAGLTMSILLSDHAFEWLKKTWLEINKEK